MRLRLTVFLWIFAVTVGVCPAAYAKPQVTTSLTQSKIQLDQRAEFKIVVEWAASEGTYTFALPELPVGRLEVVRQGESQETFRSAGMDLRRKTFSYILKPLESGQGTLGPMSIPYVSSSGTETGQVDIPQSVITLSRIPIYQSPRFRYGLAATLAAGVLIGIGIRLKQMKPAPAQPMQDRKESYIQHLKEFAQDFQPEATKDLLYQLSGELKRFLSECYQLAPSVTENEIIEHLKLQRLAPEELAEISRLLSQLHEAKYAGTSLSKEKFSLMNQAVIRFIEGKQVRGGAVRSS